MIPNPCWPDSEGCLQRKYLYHPSTKTGISLDGKSCTAGIEKQSHGHVRQILHWGPLIASGFGSKLIFRIIIVVIIIENRFNWREVVPGNVSLPVVERWHWGARQITRCSCGGHFWVNRFGTVRRLHLKNGRFELTKFESICLRKQQSQLRLLGSMIFHRIPRVCAVMECIQWVAWRTSSVWTSASLSWCLHAFGRSKSSDAMPRAKESTEFDSPFQGKHSFETSSSAYAKKVSVPGRSCGCIEFSLMERRSTYPYKPCWNLLSLGMEGGEMIWIVCWCLYSIRLFKPSLLSGPTSQNGGRLFLVYMLGIGLTTSGDGFWVIWHWQDSDKAKSFGAYVLVVTGPSNIKCRNVKLEFFVAAQLRKLFAPYHVRKCKCLPKASGS